MKDTISKTRTTGCLRMVKQSLLLSRSYGYKYTDNDIKVDF